MLYNKISELIKKGISLEEIERILKEECQSEYNGSTAQIFIEFFNIIKNDIEQENDMNNYNELERLRGNIFLHKKVLPLASEMIELLDFIIAELNSLIQK